jgi:FAD/FMN-containing dehydrogenase
LTHHALAALEAEFGADRLLHGSEATAPFLVDWFGAGGGRALAVLRPRDVAEVQAMVRACARLGLGIVPQGGNTGLVHGAIPEDDAQVVLSLGRLDRIRRIDPDDYACVVEAGAVLQTVKAAAAALDLYLPLSIGAQGTAQIGGVISTNAGGLNVLRYGMMREQVLGLEVVLADGARWDGLTTLRKNNMGPDLKQLFVGSEGAFGVITAAALRLSPRPAARAAALLGLPDLDATMQAFHLARRACSDLLSAFEFLTPAAMAIARDAMQNPPALATDCGVYALVELAAPGPVDLDALLLGFFEAAHGRGLVQDGVVAASEAQAERLWALREAVNEGQARRGPFLRSDVSVRLSDLPRFVTRACAAIETALPAARRRPRPQRPADGPASQPLDRRARDQHRAQHPDVLPRRGRSERRRPGAEPDRAGRAAAHAGGGARDGRRRRGLSLRHPPSGGAGNGVLRCLKPNPASSASRSPDRCRARR